MRTLKLLFLAVVLSTSTMAFADNPGKKVRSVSYEIEQLLKDSNLLIESNLTVSVFFKLTEDNKIEIRSIKSENEEVAEFLAERLSNKKVYGRNWDQDKLYELPVRVQATKN